MALLQIGLPDPGASFEQPFDMLAACHERVTRSLGLLGRLVSYLDKHPLDEQAREAARDVKRYFDLAAPAHHLDEERHLFPVLEAAGDAKLRALAQVLRQQHDEIAMSWAVLRPLLVEVGAGRMLSHARLVAAARHFSELNTAHLLLEDQQAFAPAHAALSTQGPQALLAMGDEMAQRRGLRRRADTAPTTPPTPP